MTLHGILWSSLIWLAACSELLVTCYFFHHRPTFLGISEFTIVNLSLLSVLVDPLNFPLSLGIQNNGGFSFYTLITCHCSGLHSKSTRSAFTVPSPVPLPFGNPRYLPIWAFASVKIAPAEKAKNFRFPFWPQSPIFPAIPLTYHYPTPSPSIIVPWLPPVFSRFPLVFYAYLGQQCQLCSNPQISCH